MFVSFFHRTGFLFLEAVSELKRSLEQLKVANQKLQRNSRGSVFYGIHDESALMRRSSESDEPIHIGAPVESFALKLSASQFVWIVSLVYTFAQLTQK